MASKYRNRDCGVAAVALLGSTSATMSPSFDRLTDLSLEDLTNSEASPTWRLHGGLPRVWQDFRLKPGSIDTADSVASTEGANPSRQWMLRSSLDLPRVSELALPQLVSRF